MGKAIVTLAVALLATPALAALTETFSYPDGNLAGNDGWAYVGANPGTNDFEVASNELHVYADQTAPVPQVANNIPDILPNGSNKIFLTMNVRTSVSGSGGAGWFHVYDLGNSVVLAGFYWNGAAFYGRNPQSGSLLQLTAALDTTTATVGMDLDFTANNVQFSFNGSPIGSSAFPAAYNVANAGVSRILFEAQVNGKGGANHIFDNLTITPEPASLFLLVLGGLFLRRRVA